MKFKKVAAILSSAAVMVSAFVLPVGAETAVIDGTLDETTGLVYKEFKIDATTGWRVSCTMDTAKKFNGEVTIPAEWGEEGSKKPVIAMDNYILVMGENATSVSIPASVVQIDIRDGYEGCSLTEIKVDSSNPNYCAEDGVLYDKNKTELICYPAKKSGETFTFPSSVTSISNTAFSGAKNLKSMAVPDGVTSINSDMFAFSGIETLSLPASVAEFEYFFIIEKLKSITVDPSNTALCSENGILFNKAKTELILYPMAKEGDTYTIPDTVTKLGDRALYNSNIQEVTIPASVTEIGYDVFWDSTSNQMKINYAGTKAEWNDITINNENFTIEQNGVTCSDGVIEGTAVDTGTAAQEPESTDNGDGTTTFTPAVESSTRFTEEQMEDVKAVQVDAPSDAFDSGVNMQVEPKSITGDTFSVDIKFVDSASGEKVQPRKAVTVKIPIPANLKNAENLNMYHVDDNGTITKVDFTIETIGGKQYVVFTATSFSEYKIVAEETSLKPSESYNPFDHGSSTGNGSRVTVSTDSTPANTSTEAAPTEPTAAETTASEASNNNGGKDQNQPTGAVIAVVPTILAIAGVVLSKKRK